MAHAVHVAQAGKEDASLRGRGHVNGHRLLKVVVGVGPGNGARLDIGAAPNPAPPTRPGGRVNGVVGIERIDGHAPRPTRPSRAAAASLLVYGAVDVEDRGAGTSLGDDRPRTAAVGGRKDPVGSAPPIDGRDQGMAGVLVVNADTGIAAAAAGRPVGGGHVGPSQGTRVEFPDLTGRDAVGSVAAAVINDPKVAVGAQAGVGCDHVGRPAGNEGPAPARVGGAVDVAVSRAHDQDTNVDGGRSRARGAVGVEDHPGKPVAGVAIHWEGGHLRPAGRRVGADPQPLPAGAEIKLGSQVGVHGQALARLPAVVVARDGDRYGVGGPGIALVRGAEDRAGAGETRRRVNHVGIHRIRRDALPPEVVAPSIHVGQGNPLADGIVPTVETADVGSRVKKALGNRAVSEPGDETAAHDDDVLPVIGLSEGETLEPEKEERSDRKCPENPSKNWPGKKIVFIFVHTHFFLEVSVAKKLGLLLEIYPRN